MTFAFELDLNPRQDNFRGNYGKVIAEKEKSEKTEQKIVYKV